MGEKILPTTTYFITLVMIIYANSIRSNDGKLMLNDLRKKNPKLDEQQIIYNVLNEYKLI